MTSFSNFGKRGSHIRNIFICGILAICIFFMSVITNSQPVLMEEKEDISGLLLNLTKEMNQIANLISKNSKQVSSSEKIKEVSSTEVTEPIKKVPTTEKVTFLDNTTIESVLKRVEKGHNFTTFTFKKNLIHKFHCPASRLEQVEWRGHFLEFNSTSTPKMNVVPTVVEESPIGIAPAIPVKFIIEEAEYCTKRPQLKAVALVPSAIMNIERRSTTRNTWGSASEELGVIFFVGVSKNQTENEIILKESQKYRDIVQGDYIDLYQFLVYKNLNAFQWLTKHCDKAKWVIHADDDSLFNTKKFINFVNNYNYPNPVEYIYCSIQCDSNTLRSGCKCAVSEEMYPYKNYPIYCSGYLWFTSMENIRSLLKVSQGVKYLWVDDVYVTGLLAERANITRYGATFRGIVDPNFIEDVFGWMMSGIDRNEHWKILEAFYLS